MIPFEVPLKAGHLIKRYKRFFADICLDDGSLITVHCVNTGAMVGFCTPAGRVWVAPLAKKPTRRLDWRWELVENDHTLVGVNTNLPNKIFEAALKAGQITDLQDFILLEREVTYAKPSRLDFRLTLPDGKQIYIEVKNVSHKRPNSAQAFFPDCVTARGLKHLQDLAQIHQAGHRAMMIYLVQRSDCTHFHFAADYDLAYALKAREVCDQGVEFRAYDCEVTPQFIRLRHALEICW